MTWLDKESRNSRICISVQGSTFISFVPYPIKYPTVHAAHRHSCTFARARDQLSAFETVLRVRQWLAKLRPSSRAGSRINMRMGSAQLQVSAVVCPQQEPQQDENDDELGDDQAIKLLNLVGVGASRSCRGR
eukprot:m.710413 g.710413  ORF g.710413 m.710413 type:complete len:132 (+) comp58759_c0_seq16:1329-1724(+)